MQYGIRGRIFVFHKLIAGLKANEPVKGRTVLGDVVCHFDIFNYQLPLVVTFSAAGAPISLADVAACQPWGINFVRQQNCNVISFACIDEDNWYRSPKFITYVRGLGQALKASSFTQKLGYGGSMGGYAVGAFANILGLDRVLLLNPISTLNKTLAPWERRFKQAAELDWDGAFYDGAACQCRGYVVFDPLLSNDYKHAQRYFNLQQLRVPGVGHAIGVPLNHFRVLKRLFLLFVKDRVDHPWFYNAVRQRRNYEGYYNWLLSDANAHLTPKRKAVIEIHRNINFPTHSHEPSDQ